MRLPLTGAVVAGGLGRRMGGDKALLDWEGRPLWERQVVVLSAAGASPVAVVRRPQQSELGCPCWRDRREDCGPLAGLEIALEHAGEGDHVAILAVDMPGITVDWFQWLLAHCAPGEGAVAQHADAFEPLAAIYPRSALAEVTARLDRRAMALQALIAALVGQGQMTVLPVPAKRLEAVQSLNYPPLKVN